MKTKIILLFTLLSSTLAFAGIHDLCHTVIDVKADEMTSDGKKVYAMPALDYEQAFNAVCKVVDSHPELWERPSREAVGFAVDASWKRKD
jgi:hypothetical protein